VPSQAGPGGLRLDGVAGLTAAAVVLPKAMAHATVAGLPVAVGLYTAFVPMAIYAQLGLVVPDGDPGKLATATATLTALVGAMLLAARLSRLGFVANFISAPVLTGFKAGIGLVIVLDQVPKLLGLHIDKHGFFVDLISLVQHLPQTSLPTLAVAAATLGGAFLGAMPAGGGTSQTAVVRSAGGRSQKASLVTSGAALATMLLLAPLLRLMPNATLAAVVIVYSVGLIEPAEFRAIRGVRTMEFR
jgi:MFS superfamily sulfate permease-like transporter